MLSLRDRLGTRGVVMTCGEHGSAVLDDGYRAIPPLPVTVVDTVGAGDGYLAAMVACLVWGKPLIEACEWASKYAAFKVTRKGTIPGYPHLADVEKFMKSHA